MLGSNHVLLNKAIDYLEYFEGNPQEVVIRNIYPNSIHWHNNSSQLRHVHIQMMVRDTDHQHQMEADLTNCIISVVLLWDQVISGLDQHHILHREVGHRPAHHDGNLSLLQPLSPRLLLCV